MNKSWWLERQLPLATRCGRVQQRENILLYVNKEWLGLVTTNESEDNSVHEKDYYYYFF